MSARGALHAGVSAVVALALFKLALSDGGRHPETLTLVQVAVFILTASAVAFGALRVTELGRVLVVMVGITAAATIWSVRPETGVREVLLWLTYLGIVVLVSSTLSSVHAVRLFADTAVAIAAWLCLIALFVFWGANNPGMRWYSTFYWPNPFAAFLLLSLPVPLLRYLHALRLREALAQGLISLLLLVSLLLTYSRGAWIAMAAVLPLAVILVRPASWPRFAGRAILLLAMTALTAFALTRGAAINDTGQGMLARAASASDLADYSIQGRLTFWRAAWEMFLDHPLLGVGPGAYGVAHPSYQQDVRYYASDAHNLYVQTLAESGVPGLVALLLIIGAAAASWRRAARASRGREDHLIIAGAGVGLAAFFLHSGMDMDWMFPANPAMAFAVMGMVAAYERVAQSDQAVVAAPRPGPRSAWLRAAAALVLVAAVAVAQLLQGAQRHYVLGQEAERHGDWSLARAHFAEAVRQNPLGARYLDAYASALLQIPGHAAAEAEQALRRAMRVDRMNAWLPLRLGVLLMSGGSSPANQEEAERLLRLSLRLDRFNRPGTYRALGRLYRAQGRVDEAAQVYREGMAIYLGRGLGQGSVLHLLLWPEVMGLFQDASEHWAEQGKPAEAARALEQLLSEDPGAVDAVLRLSDLYVRMDRRSDARALLEATDRRIPNHPKIIEALHAFR